jgi:hypothetical protein
MRVKIYIISSAIVWAAIIASVWIILKDSPYLRNILPILGGGAAWFVIIAPAMFRNRQNNR